MKLTNKRKFILIFIITLSLLQISECSQAKFIKRTRIIMDTVVTIIADASSEIVEEAFEEMEKIDLLMNAFNPNSEVALLNQKGEMEVSLETKEIIQRAIEFSKITEGAFDITCGPVCNLWRRAGKEDKIPTREQLSSALSLVDYRSIVTEGNKVRFSQKGMQITLGGIAKGYAVDKAMQVLRRQGVTQALVNAGGDMYCLGEGPKEQAVREKLQQFFLFFLDKDPKEKKWGIGIQDPRDKDKIIGMIKVKDKGVATSGDYRRYVTIQGKRFSHIVNPATGLTVQNVPMSVTIIAPDATTADALATGVFVLGPEMGIKLINKLPGVEGMIVSEGERITYSQGWSRYQN